MQKLQLIGINQTQSNNKYVVYKGVLDSLKHALILIP